MPSKGVLKQFLDNMCAKNSHLCIELGSWSMNVPPLSQMTYEIPKCAGLWGLKLN